MPDGDSLKKAAGLAGAPGSVDSVSGAEDIASVTRDDLVARLQQSEDRFRGALDAIEGVMWTNSAEGEMVGDQPKWAELTGQSYEQYQGYGWADAVHPDDAQPTIDAWQDAVRAASTFTYEHRVRRHDGQWRLCAIRAVPVRNEDGTIREWVGVHRDITDRRTGEMRLRQVAENVEAVFYIHEPDSGQTLYVSPAYEKIWRQPASVAYSRLRGFVEQIHPDDRERVRTTVFALEDQASCSIEFRLKFADQQERVIHDQPSMSIDPFSGKRIVVGFATDVTEHHNALELLKRNAETFTNLVKANPFGIYVVDGDFKLTEVSLGASKVFENIDPLIGRDFAEILRVTWTEPFASEAIAQFRRTLETGEPYISLSLVEQRANIDQIEAYDWRIERIILPDGQFGVVCYFYDLSERNSYEVRLRLLIDEKETLAREIDHRVKNSLAIVGSLLSMQRSTTSSEETRAALAEATNRVIAVARVHERLHKSHHVGILAFAEYLEKLCQDIANSLHRSGVELVFNADPVELAAEQAMSLALVANELVTNAFKHGCAAGAKRITVTLLRRPDTLLLTVADDGAGLPLTQEANTSGLGFKVIKTLSNQLGAVLTVPKPGSVAEFHLVVPYTPATNANS